LLTTRDSTSDLGSWRTVHQPAAPSLAGYVHGYFASASRVVSPLQERHLPSAEVPLFINFGDPHRSVDRDTGRRTTHDGMWMVGLQRQHQLTTAIGTREFMIVRFTPVGAHLLLKVPMTVLEGAVVDLALLNPTLARAVDSRVRRARTWAARFSAMESLIAERLAHCETHALANHAWQALVCADGRVSLAALAKELGCSHRALIQHFRTAVGMPPKAMARLLRFNRVVRSLDRLSRTRHAESVSKPFIETSNPAHRLGGSVPWADVAADCGYADQAHLIKEFHAFAGRTPEAFLRSVSYRA